MSTALVPPHHARASHRDLMALARFWEWERTVERELPRVIADGEIDILFQPIYRIDDGVIAARGFEALSRFPVAPRIPLGLWFLTARDKGLSPALEIAAIEAAIRELGRVHREAFLCVNASRESLPRLANSIPAALQGRLVIELPYSAVRRPGSKWLFELLRRAGAGIAVDDLSIEDLRDRRTVLSELQPDCIKVDVNAGLAENHTARADLAEGAAWCREAGIALIAERVERVADLGVLESAGVEWAQGYSLSPPIDL